MLVYPAGLTDAEVQASLDQMAQSITMQAQSMLTKSTDRMFKWKTHWFIAWLTGYETSWGWILLFLQGPRIHNISKSLWKRYIRFWLPRGPRKQRKLSCLPIRLRMLHTLGARCGRIVEHWAELWSLGSCLRQLSWNDSSPWIWGRPRFRSLSTLIRDQWQLGSINRSLLNYPGMILPCMK